jgi:hypothetical protein
LDGNTFVNVKASEEEMKIICSLNVDSKDSIVNFVITKEGGEDNNPLSSLLFIISNSDYQITIKMECYSFDDNSWHQNSVDEKTKSKSSFPDNVIHSMLKHKLVDVYQLTKFQVYEEKRFQVYKFEVNLSKRDKLSHNISGAIQGDCWWDIYNAEENSNWEQGKLTAFSDYAELKLSRELKRFQPPQNLLDSPSEQEELWTNVIDSDISSTKIIVTSNIFPPQVYDKVIKNLLDLENEYYDGRIITSINVMKETSRQDENFKQNFDDKILLLTLSSSTSSWTMEPTYIYLSKKYNFDNEDSSVVEEYTILQVSSLLKLWNLLTDKIKCQFHCSHQQVIYGRNFFSKFTCEQSLSMTIEQKSSISRVYHEFRVKYHFPKICEILQNYLPRELQNIILLFEKK